MKMNEIKIGNEVLVNGEWFIVEDIDGTDSILFCSDEDGDERAIPFNCVEDSSAITSSMKAW